MFIPNPSEGGSFTPVPAGSHLAVCYRIIDLGTQKVVFQNENKFLRKVMVSWELPDEKMDDGRPFVISKRYTWSMHEKATLRKHLEAWRGKGFSEEDFGHFDIKDILGKGCVLSIVSESKDGKTFANISSVGKLIKGTQVPEFTTNPITYLWIHRDRWDQNIFNSLSTNIQETIRGTPEYQELMKSSSSAGDLPEQYDRPLYDDDIPF